MIHSFVRLALPSPVPEAEVVETGIEGAWPDYPQETFPPGQVRAGLPAAGSLGPMRYGDLPLLYAPVVAHPVQRATAPAAPDPAPESGARWGKASAFSWSNQAALARNRTQGVSIEYPDGDPPEYMRIIDAELTVQAERVRVVSPDDPDIWVEIDRVTRMAFHYTEFPPKPDPSSLQPSLTTYYDLAFDLHPPASEEA